MRAYKTNQMTPEVLKYEICTDRVVELSKGEGFDNKAIFGVTEMLHKSGTHYGFESTTRSQVFYDRVIAKKHYRELIKTAQ
jgi:hypothetical protein